MKDRSKSRSRVISWDQIRRIVIYKGIEGEAIRIYPQRQSALASQIAKRKEFMQISGVRITDEVVPAFRKYIQRIDEIDGDSQLRQDLRKAMIDGTIGGAILLIGSFLVFYYILYVMDI